MRLFRSWLSVILLFLAGCGGFSGFLVISNGRLLLSITISPTFADPVHFSGGRVQFTASGSFNMAPMTENPMANVIWTVDRTAFSTAPDPGHAFISPNGMATCAAGFIGMVQVIATAAANPNQPLSQANQVVGTARMNCP